VQTIAIAMYLDFENLPKRVDFSSLMSRTQSGGAPCVFSVKAAFGSVTSLPKGYRQQLRDNNFLIVDTPHVAKKKNRADLLISIDAFERLLLGRPAIDRFVFVTSDSDFSVIMDKVRAYGKEAWLVCRKADQAKKILGRSCDRMLVIEDFLRPLLPQRRTVDPERDLLANRLFKQVLRKIGMSRLPVDLSVVGGQMREIDSSFNFKETSFKQLTKLAAHFEKAGMLRLGYHDNGVTKIEDMDDLQLEIECCDSTNICFP
jgi:hypothetical protein